MDVGEQDFSHFKREQHILVEFNVFPLKMIELIELCLITNGSLELNSSTGKNQFTMLDTE